MLLSERIMMPMSPGYLPSLNARFSKTAVGQAVVDPKPQTWRRGVRMIGDSFEKVRDFLEREFEAAAEAGEDVELYIRRLAKDLSDTYDPIDALADDSEKTKGLIDEGRYYRIKNGVTMDSGCSVFVMPSDWTEIFDLEESEGSRRGQTFQAASKDSKPIKNEGQRTVKFVTKDGEKRKMVCQVAAVNKILASVGQICDGGNEVLFRHDGGEIRHLKTNKTTFSGELEMST